MPAYPEVTEAALDSLTMRLQRDGIAYHYAPVGMGRRDAFKETTQVSMTLEQNLGIPVFFDRISGNQFELWVEEPIQQV
jgi:hypothetical protein